MSQLRRVAVLSYIYIIIQFTLTACARAQHITDSRWVGQVYCIDFFNRVTTPSSSFLVQPKCKVMQVHTHIYTHKRTQNQKHFSSALPSRVNGSNWITAMAAFTPPRSSARDWAHHLALERVPSKRLCKPCGCVHWWQGCPCERAR